MTSYIGNVENITNTQLKKLRAFVGVRTINQLISRAGNEIDLGVRPSTKRRRALNYWKGFYNNAVDIVRKSQEEERKNRRNENRRVDRMIKKIKSIRICWYY